MSLREELCRWMSMSQLCLWWLYYYSTTRNFYDNDSACLSVSFWPDFEKRVQRKFRDKDLTPICQQQCVDEAKACQNECDSSECSSACLDQLVACDKNCPCNENCLEGCMGCMTNVCFCDVDESPDAQICFDKLEAELDRCLEQCNISDQDSGW